MNKLDEFDPLEDAQEPSDILKLAKKVHIKNILKSYTGWYDPFSELLQNALDAVEKRMADAADSYKPEIKVEINLKNNSVRVTDNGIGFSPDQITLFLTPHITYKSLAKLRGHKGVGATYLAYGFNYLEFGTKTPSFSYYGAIENAREWVDEITNTLSRPKVIKSQPTDSTLDSIDRGSTFMLKFTGQNTRPKDINWIGIADAEKWSQILRVVTPIGGIYLEKDLPKIKCTVTVVDKNNKITTKVIDKCEYLYPHQVFEPAAKLSDIVSAKKKLAEANKDTLENLPGNLRKLKGIYEKWTTPELLESEIKKTLDDVDVELLKQYKPNVYGFYSYTQRLWGHYNENVLGLRRGQEVLKGGLQMATKNMIQGELIEVTLDRFGGYQKSSLVIFQLHDAEPDLGRKGFQPEIVDLAKKITKAIVKYFIKWNEYLERDAGEKIDLNKGKTTYEWKKSLEDYAKNHPMRIENKNFFLPMMEIPILSQPQTEQDVIVLFSQLLAGGVIRGIRLYGTSQSEKYDSVCKAFISEPLKNHEYNEVENPLGIKLPQEIADSEPWILEYKYNFDALIGDFSNELKDEKEIKLVVCWEAGNSWKDRYHITTLLHKNFIHHRPFHGATHAVKIPNSDNTTFYLIVLSELIQYLNNPQESQQYQENSYTT